MEARLKENGAPTEAIVEALTRLPEDLEHANTPDFYDSLFIADNLEETYRSLRGFIYGEDGDQLMENGEKTEENGDKDATTETDAKDTVMEGDSAVNGGATETEPGKEQEQEQEKQNGA